MRAKSLRFWIALSRGIAVVPLLFSAGVGYLVLDRGVVAPIHDVAMRQRTQIAPAQHLQVLIWDTLIPVDEYVEEGNPVHPEAYRHLRTRIESGMAELFAAVERDPAAKVLLERARANWTAADGYATELISVPMQPDEPRAVETLQRFHGEVVATSDKLEALYDQLANEIQKDHDIAMLSYERSMWLAGIAGTVSLLAIGLGTLLIGRLMTASVDRLVDGVQRVSEGDRDHRIEVQVPPELHRVAEEFNRMIGRIRESEEALSDLAHLDSLTGLPNRRAFDEAYADMRARSQRFDEPLFLLAIDADRFKRINDTHGHAAGDEVLRMTANVLSRNLRPVDKAYRIGGEEFAVVLPNMTVDQAREAAERLRRAIAATPVPYDGNEIGLTVSIGVARGSDGLEQSVVMEAADAALYRAKAGGRNQVVVSGEVGRRNQDAA